MFRLDVAEELFDLGQGCLRIDVAGNDQDRVVRRVPGVVKALERLRRGLLERGPGSECIVLIGSAREHCSANFFIQDIGRLGHILRDLLLDGAALVIPLLFGVEYGPHPDGFYMECHVEVFGRHGVQVLRETFASVRVEVAADHAADVG